MSIERYRIGVIMGGTSAEREVSLKSGASVCKALGELGLDHEAIDADRSICSKLADGGIDLAFIALHGGWGEDGSIQGLLEIMGIPYTGSGVLASALAMDKEASKKIFLHHGINVAPYFVIKDRDREINDDVYLSRGLRLPLFIKPSAEGSSVGVSFVKDGGSFKRAVSEAFKYGDRVIVERYIKGREIHIGILGDRVLGGVEVRPSDEFYSYRAKYTGGVTDYITPPELDRDTYERAKDIALKAHKALGCAGATRVDLIIEESDEIYALEVNTIPGMTETSLLPKIAASAGYDFKGLIKEIIVDALKIRGID